MRVKIKVDNKVFEKEVPNKMHLDAQINFPSFKQRPKKGKGSFTRKEKYKNKYLTNY